MISVATRATRGRILARLGLAGRAWVSSALRSSAARRLLPALGYGMAASVLPVVVATVLTGDDVGLHIRVALLVGTVAVAGVIGLIAPAGLPSRARSARRGEPC